MRSPSLVELPPPPPGKAGWPWTEETPPVGAALHDGFVLPRVSIVTPSFNQGPFLEETIRSVLLQGYPDLEYIIIDGGSTDDSVPIIRKYEKWLAYWVSEKDSGQTQAINKGFARSTGEICAYLNSDDVYLPDALHNIASFFDNQPEVALVYGDCQLIDDASRVIDLWIAPEFSLRELIFRCYIAQQAAFWRKSTSSEIGDFNAEMHYAFDYEMWLRISAGHRPAHVPIILAQHRKAEGTKTVSRPEAFAAEIIGALQTFFRSPDLSAAFKSIEPDAYAIAFLNQALLSFRLHRIPEAREALQRAFESSPNLVGNQRERVIGALVNNTDSSGPLDSARRYLELVFAQLPPNAYSLRLVKPSALRRVEILHAARSNDRQALRRARRLLLPTLINDSDWMRNRAARREFLGVLIGHAAIRRLAEFKHLLRTTRSAIPNTRKDYA